LTQQLPLEPAARPDDRERVLKMTIAYDGGDFRGFAPQLGARTVHGVLTETLEMVLQREIDLVGAGRTDAGVHAWGQVVSLAVPASVDPAAIARSCNSLLGPEVVVRAAEMVDPSFDARHSAKWRAYRYTIVNQPVPDPFLARTAWWVSEPIDLSLLRLGTDPFLGEHDFASFCRTRPGRGTPVRRVLDAVWCADADGVLQFEIRATAFCWQMVRSIVGTLVDVGVGKIRPGEILAILRAGDRNVAGRVAPPHGLCLREVGY
jgi:tRNA pseudouridine38-40 synthase